jgi:hypothetical protein
MMRLHPGTRIIISWEPDCFLEVIIVITTPLEPLENQNSDNN